LYFLSFFWGWCYLFIIMSAITLLLTHASRIHNRLNNGSSSSSSSSNAASTGFVNSNHAKPIAALKVTANFSVIAATANTFISFFDTYLRVCALLVGLVATSLVQPLFISFMVLLWIGDEKFKAYLFPDLNTLAPMTLSLPTGEFFSELLKWSLVSTLIGICSIIVSIVFFYSSWRNTNNQTALNFLSSTQFANQLKQYFVIYYSIWLLVYWFEITVIFFGYIGKIGLLALGKDIELEVNSNHNLIGLCFLASFVVFITMADFLIQDIFRLRAHAPRPSVMECQRQE